jgi:AraC-like DNA-binding protein
MPNGNTELFFNLEDTEYEISSVRYKVANKRTFIAGLHNAYLGSYMCISSSLKFFTVVFKPLGAHRLIGINESDLTNRVMDGEDVLGKEINRVWEEMSYAHDIKQMAHIVECYFSRVVRSVVFKACEFDHISREIRRQNGLRSVGQLADKLDMHKRNLERSFERNIGLSPWDYSRICRLNYIFKLAISGADLMDIVFKTGYYDQAHFANDFKRMTETAPRQFLKTIPAFFYNKSVMNRIYIPLPEQPQHDFQLPERIVVNAISA